MKKINVGVYAISCRTGGALSVLSDFYNEISSNEYDKYNINWIIFTSVDIFENRENITIINCKKYIKTWLHRYYFNIIVSKKCIKKYNIEAMISLQNMQIFGYKGVSVISLHNVLPLYKCDKTVLDTLLKRIKQRIVNKLIKKSLKKSNFIIVPSNWIKNELIVSLKIEDDKIIVEPVNLPRIIFDFKTDNYVSEETIFFYPAKSFPYKNHKTIVDACVLLKKRGIVNYRVLFTIKKEESKTADWLYKYVEDNNLPIEFVGVLKREQVITMYKNNILIFSSCIETDAMPLIEAKSIGGLILSADLPYSRETLNGYQNAYFYKLNDSSELSILMEKCINNSIEKRITLTEYVERKNDRIEKIIDAINKCIK